MSIETKTIHIVTRESNQGKKVMIECDGKLSEIRLIKQDADTITFVAGPSLKNAVETQ